MSDDPTRLRLLAVLAFAGHYPAVRILGRRKLRPEWVRKNLLAIGATFAAMGAAGALGARLGHPALAVLAAFSTGHFVWSGWLAWGIVNGVALLPEEPAAA
jgi:hypothetical protein